MKSGAMAYGAIAVLCLTAAASRTVQDPRKEALRKKLGDDDVVGDWIYDDVPAGFARAKKTGKPLLFVFR